MFTRQFLAIITILFSFGAWAQEEGHSQVDFGEANEFVEIPEQFRDEDAVIVFSEEIVECDFDADFFVSYAMAANSIEGRGLDYSSLLTSYSGLIVYKVHKRFRILTKDGLDKYSFVTVENHKNAEIVSLDARTIKPDGTVHDLESEDIKEIDITRASELAGGGDAKKRFAIPGVEIGDEIEVVYEVKGHGMFLVEDFYFHTNIPILSSNLTLKLRLGIYPQMYYYNGAILGRHSVEKNYAVYSWSSHNLPGYSNTANSRKSGELPFVRLVTKEIKIRINTIEKTIPIMPESWDDVFSSIEDDYMDEGIRNNRAGYVKSFIKQLEDDNPDASNFELFYKFYQYVQDSVEVRSLKEWEESYKSGYYLHKRFINHKGLYKLYRKAFKLLDIDYNLCLAVKKTKPQIDTNIISPYYFDHYLFILHNEDKSYYLYPSTKTKKYVIDEIPVSVEGTRALVVPNEKKEEKIKLVNLPQGTYKDNYINRRCQISFSKDTNVVSAKISCALSGAASTRYRSSIEKNISNYKKDSIDILRIIFPYKLDIENKLEIDTIIRGGLTQFYPFKYKFSVSGNYENLLTQLDDSTYSISMYSLIEHNILMYSERERLLDYIPYCPISDSYSYYLVFDGPVEVLNREALSFNLENEVGSYEMKVESVKDNMLMVTSKYVIKTNYIPKEKYSQLIDVSKSAEEAEETSILLKY